MNTRALLIVCALVELGAGAPLLAAPSFTAKLLLGPGLDTPGAVMVGRVAGGALLSIAVCCWLARNARDGAVSAVVTALLVYNALTAVLLLYGALVDRMSGIGLWPALALHAGIAIWCALRLRPAARA